MPGVHKLGSQKTFNFTLRRHRPPLISCPSSRSVPGVAFQPRPSRPALPSLSGARVYERVKRIREDERRKRTMLCDVLHYINDGRACQQWLSKQAAMWVCYSAAVKVPPPPFPADLHHRRQAGTQAEVSSHFGLNWKISLMLNSIFPAGWLILFCVYSDAGITPAVTTITPSGTNAPSPHTFTWLHTKIPPPLFIEPFNK